MASDRRTTSRSSAAEGRASAEALPLEEAQSVKDKTADENPQPSAGRTGKLGARAERPADGRARKSKDALGEPTRGGKAPSPAAKDGADDDLPQPVRDATG